jgi:hypothetical protein
MFKLFWAEEPEKAACIPARSRLLTAKPHSEPRAQARAQQPENAVALVEKCGVCASTQRGLTPAALSGASECERGRDDGAGSSIASKQQIEANALSASICVHLCASVAECLFPSTRAVQAISSSITLGSLVGPMSRWSKPWNG